MEVIKIELKIITHFQSFNKSVGISQLFLAQANYSCELVSGDGRIRIKHLYCTTWHYAVEVRSRDKCLEFNIFTLDI